MVSKSLSRKRLAFAFVTAVGALLIVGVISYRGMILSSESDRWVQHSQDVLTNVDHLLVSMQGVESNCSGFLLTGDPSYLQLYRDDVQSAVENKEKIRTLLQDNPAQEARFQTLDSSSIKEIQGTQFLLKIPETYSKAEARTLQLAQSSLAATFQRDVRNLRDEERGILESRNQVSRLRLRQTKFVLILGTLLGLMIAVAAGWNIQRDNANRGLAEDALRESEEKYRMLLDGIQDHAIFLLNPLGSILSWNAGAERIQGYNADDIIGRNYSCLFSTQDQARHWPAEILELTKARGRYEEQGLLVRADGSRYLAYVTVTTLRDKDDAFQGFSVVSRDLTESKESGAKYRGLLEAAPDAMVVVDPGGVIVLLNVQAEKQFGYHRDELVGKKVTTIIPEGFAERIIADGTRTAADALAQQIGTGIELAGRRKDGSMFPIEIMLSPLQNSEGILITTAIRDITTRKRAEANLLHKVEALNRSNEELGQFAYIASHDLQEPLRMVASYTQLLSRRYKGRLDSDADEFIAFAVDGASRMQRLIRDLLSFSRVETTGKELLKTSSEDSLEQAKTNLRGALEASGAVITHDPLPHVLADEMQLVQLFQNLVGNAVKYRRSEQAIIHISATPYSEGRWAFTVRDNGIGIDTQYFDRIFGMFQRLHKREEFEGTGIGLAICKKIVERHGGIITVESTIGSGSCFRFDLAASGENV
jgi:PAS domain S-box-containing protein